MDCMNEISLGFGGLKILLVDKDQNSLMNMSTILEEHSYQVTTTTSGVVALSMIVEGTFDLILSEIDMPGIDGFELLKKISSKVDIPILLMSATEDPELPSVALNIGACFFYHKPIEAHNLVHIWQYFHHHTLEKNKLKKGMVPTEVEKFLHGFHGKRKSSSILGKMPLPNSLEVMRNGDESNHSEESINLRKRIREDDEDKDKSNTSSSKQKAKTQRCRWTPKLQQKFKEAYEALGEFRATPSNIKELMNEPDLTPQHINSYLQKFRRILKDEKKEVTKHEVHDFIWRPQKCLFTNPSSLHSSLAPYQFNPLLNISSPNHCHIQIPGELVQNVWPNYNTQTIECPTQMANHFNFKTNASNMVINHFSQKIPRNIGPGLQPSEISATWVTNHLQDENEAPNTVIFKDNIGVAKCIPGGKPHPVQELNGGLGMVGDNIKASEGNVVSQVKEQNGDLGMKGDNIDDMSPVPNSKEIDNIIQHFLDNDFGKGVLPLGLNVSANSITPIPETTTGEEQVTENSNDNLVEDDINGFVDMLFE